MRLARGPGDMARQQGRLVVAAAKQTPAMQRDRRNQIRILQQFGAGMGEPASQGRRGIGSVGMFESDDQATAGIVITKGRPSARVGRTLSQTGTAKRFAVTLGLAILEWVAAASTAG